MSFLIDPFTEQLQNEAQNPIIFKQKLVIVSIKNPTVGKVYNFSTDKHLDNSIIKGIRFEPKGNVSPQTIRIGNSGINSLPGVYATAANSLVCRVNLVNEKDQNIINDRPLYTFIGVRGDGTKVVARPQVVPRFNIRLVMRKCNIQINSNIFDSQTVNFLFTFTYLPLK